MTAIDIGAPAIYQQYGYGPDATLISEHNPANLSGKITSVDIFAYAGWPLTEAVVGTFYTTNGNTLKCRDSAYIGDVPAGSMQTFPGLDITVEAGDYIGIYFLTGHSYIAISGGDGAWDVDGEHIDPGDEASYLHHANWLMSLYGRGEEVGVVVGRSFGYIMG